MSVNSPFQKQRNAHHGLALILALVALIVTAGFTVALARLAVVDRTTRSLDDAQRLADDLLQACEEPILNWLKNESAQVVLPPDADIPAVRVLHDRWVHGNRDIEIDLVAFDQMGMAAPDHLETSVLLRLAIPADVLDFIDARIEGEKPATGLDEYRQVENAGLSIYPRLIETLPTWYGSGQPASSGGYEPPLPTSAALGGWIATHNPPPGRINVHTAPLPLVEQALREAGRGGYELILAARETGEPVSMGDIPSSGDASERAPRLVGASGAWAMRIDIRVGTLRRSWWAVYQRQNRGWECVQRHVITE